MWLGNADLALLVGDGFLLSLILNLIGFGLSSFNAYIDYESTRLVGVAGEGVLLLFVNLTMHP